MSLYFSPLKEQLDETSKTISKEIETTSSLSKVHLSPRQRRQIANEYQLPTSTQARDQKLLNTAKNILQIKDVQTDNATVASNSSCSRASKISKLVEYRDAKYSQSCRKLNWTRSRNYEPFSDRLRCKRAIMSHDPCIPLCSSPTTFDEQLTSFSTTPDYSMCSDPSQADLLDRDPQWPVSNEFPFADPLEDPPDYVRTAISIISSLMTHTVRLEEAAAISRRIRLNSKR